MSEFIIVDFISFKSMYPKFLYPGGDTKDLSNKTPSHENLFIKENLTWYNPISWFIAAISIKSKTLHIQWWSLPLFPVFFSILVIFKLRGGKAVLTLHNVEPHEKSFLYSLTTKLLCTLANKVIVHTKVSIDHAHNKFSIPRSKISVINHGILKCEQLDINRKSARLELGLPINDLVIICFGAIRNYKGLDYVIEAFETLKGTHNNVRLLIAGAKWKISDQLERKLEQAKIQDNIHLHLKYIPESEIQIYLSCADIGLLPYSSFNSQSGAGLLLINSNIPLIVSNTGGLPDLIPEMYKKYAIIDNINSSKLHSAILPFIESAELLYDYKKAIKEHKHNFLWPEIAKETIYQHKILSHKQ